MNGDNITRSTRSQFKSGVAFPAIIVLVLICQSILSPAHAQWWVVSYEAEGTMSASWQQPKALNYAPFVKYRKLKARYTWSEPVPPQYLHTFPVWVSDHNTFSTGAPMTYANTL